MTYVKLLLSFLLAVPLHAAIIANIQLSIAVDGGGPLSTCHYNGPGPNAECEVSGRGLGQARANIDNGLISIGAGGNGAIANIYATATLDALYNTAFVGNLFAVLNYQCSTGGSHLAGSAGFGNIVSSDYHPDSKQETVLLPVQAANGQIQFDATWYAVVSTVGDSEYATSALAVIGFRDAMGHEVGTTIASEATVPEPGTWGSLALGLVAIIRGRRDA